MTEAFKVYEVRGDNDKTEGRGGTYLVGYYKNQDIANQASKNHGVMGSSGYISKHDAIEIDGSVFLIKEKITLSDDVEIKLQNIMKKLSSEEINLLKFRFSRT